MDKDDLGISTLTFVLIIALVLDSGGGAAGRRRAGRTARRGNVRAGDDTLAARVHV